MARIKIKKGPTNSSVPNQMSPGFYGKALQKPSTEVARSIQSVPRDEANIEAEKGETALFPDKGGLPAHFNIDGARHTNGGTPLNVPSDTFIFSDTKKMRIKDPEILAEFGKSKGSWTPADLAKKYNINKFRKLVQDPDSDPIQVKTGEKMIANYNLKLGKLALVQESKKGFPQGIPAVAMPYLATFNIKPDSILPLKTKDQGQQGMLPQGLPQGKYGLSMYQNAGAVSYAHPEPITMDPSQIMAPPVTPSLFGPGQTMELPPSNTGMWNTPQGTVPPVVTPQPDQWEHSTGRMKYKPGHSSMNPEDAVNWGLAGASLVTSAFNTRDTRKKEEDLQKRFAADKIFASNDQRDRGDYTRNAGYFRPDQQGDGRFITKFGGSLPKAQGGGISPEQAKAIFDEAIRSGDPVKMRNAKKMIEERKDSPWYSGAWNPFADEWDFDLYEDQLKTRADQQEDTNKRSAAYSQYKDQVEKLYPAYKAEYDRLMANPTSESKIDFKKLQEVIKAKNELGNYESMKKGKYTGKVPDYLLYQKVNPNAFTDYTALELPKKPVSSGPAIAYDQSLLPIDDYMTGPPVQPVNRIRITKAPGSVAPAVKSSSTPKAPPATTSTGMTIQEYMKEYDVDEATAIELKKAEQ